MEGAGNVVSAILTSIWNNPMSIKSTHTSSHQLFVGCVKYENQAVLILNKHPFMKQTEEHTDC